MTDDWIEELPVSITLTVSQWSELMELLDREPKALPRLRAALHTPEPWMSNDK